ncbi:MAG: SusC/RagA family TonB-linked outer membrane protein [Bacteroidales bacterium]
MEKITRYRFKYLLILLLLPTVFGVSAQDRVLNLDFKNAALSQVLDEIARQSSYSVVYNDSDVNSARLVNIKANHEKLSTVMDKILANTNTSYAVRDKHLVLFSGANKPENKQAQQKRIIKGSVTDEKGEPLIGVSVLVAGTITGTITDVDGLYSIEVPGNNSVLEFSYIGYPKVQLSIAGRTSFNVVMKESAQQLGEVVVTAMGIERAAKSLTYATQTVKGAELTRAKDANFINSLQGKSAGLVITPNSGGAGSASKILLRGNKSIMGANSPLIVIDGIPMINKVNDQLGSDGGYAMAYSAKSEGSDVLSSINPDDIESITVLKGANSAALYGTAAANGVIMITTKTGKEGHLSIDVSSSSMFETPLTSPKIQNHFGAKFNDDGTLQGTSWGKPLSEMTPEQLARQGITNVGRDNISNFFNTGTNFFNSIALSGGTEKIKSYFSYGNTTSKGIIPNNKFERHNVLFRQNYNLYNKKVKIDLSANYIHQETQNRIGGGTFSNPLFNLYLAPRNLDMNYYKNNYEVQGEWDSEKVGILYPGPNGIDTEYKSVKLKGPMQNWFQGRGVLGANNPYWLTNRVGKKEFSKRFMGSVGVTYEIFTGFSAQARFRYDRNEINTESKTYATTIGPVGTMVDRGQYGREDKSEFSLFADYLLSYNKQISDFNFTGNVGFSFEKNKGDSYWSLFSPLYKAYYTKIEDVPTTINHFLPDTKILANSSYGMNSDWGKGLFATFSLGYKGMAYLDASYRMDWTRAFSQFESIGFKPWFGYYSIGGNVLVNEVFKMNEEINRFKVRLSYSEVGNSIPNSFYTSMTLKPEGGVVAVETADFDPRPETMRSVEAGVDLGLFNNALDLNFTFYNTMSLNQFLQVASSVAQVKPINTGKVRNRGIEMTATYNLWNANGFSWSTGVNFSYNNNKIIETFEHRRDIKNTIGTAGNLHVRYLEGGSYGDLYCKDFTRYNKFDEELGLGKEGDIKLDPNGNPSMDARGGYEHYLGNMNAKYNLGWHNTFRYKGFSLYLLIDGKIGGKVVSFTEAYLDAYGVSERSANARLSGLEWNGVPAAVMPDGNLTSAESYYSTIGSQIFPSEYIYDGTNFRLREVSLGYTFKKLPGFIKMVNISAVARNLFFIYKDCPVDPDVSMSTANGLGGIDIFNLPTTRSFGVNLKLSF